MSIRSQKASGAGTEPVGFQDNRLVAAFEHGDKAKGKTRFGRVGHGKVPGARCPCPAMLPAGQPSRGRIREAKRGVFGAVQGD
jgi:hypothetical protein